MHQITRDLIHNTEEQINEAKAERDEAYSLVRAHDLHITGMLAMLDLLAPGGREAQFDEQPSVIHAGDVDDEMTRYHASIDSLTGERKVSRTDYSLAEQRAMAAEALKANNEAREGIPGYRSPEQKARDYGIMYGMNPNKGAVTVIVTGPAGSGKTVLLDTLARFLGWHGIGTEIDDHEMTVTLGDWGISKLEKIMSTTTDKGKHVLAAKGTQQTFTAKASDVLTQSLHEAERAAIKQTHERGDKHPAPYQSPDLPPAPVVAPQGRVHPNELPQPTGEEVAEKLTEVLPDYKANLRTGFHTEAPGYVVALASEADDKPRNVPVNTYVDRHDIAPVTDPRMANDYTVDKHGNNASTHTKAPIG